MKQEELKAAYMIINVATAEADGGVTFMSVAELNVLRDTLLTLEREIQALEVDARFLKAARSWEV